MTYTPTSTTKPKSQNLRFSIFDRLDETDVKDIVTDTSTAESVTKDDDADMPTEEVINFVNKKWLPYANRKLKQFAA